MILLVGIVGIVCLVVGFSCGFVVGCVGQAKYDYREASKEFKNLCPEET